MKNLDKKTEFDKRWEEAFADAEMTPPEVVWDRIDAAMSKEEVGYFRRKAFIFKMLAAASIAFALGVGIFSINHFLKQDSKTKIAILDSNSIEIPDDKSKTETLTSDLGNDKLISDNIPNQIENIDRNASTKSFTQENLTKYDNSSGSTENMQMIRENDNIPFDKYEPDIENKFSSLTSISALGLIQESQEENLIALDHIYLIPIMPKGASKVKRGIDSNILLAGLDFSTGIFDPNFELGESVFASNGFSAVSDARVETYKDQLTSFNTSNKDFAMVRSSGRENEPEIAFSYGAYVGFKITRRILLQTGFAYRKANSTTTTTGYIEEIGSDTKIPIVASHQYQLDGLSSVNRIPQTDLRNQYEFASIPIKAGYVFLDKKINLALMAGISPEFFLNNKIIDQSNFLETLSSSSGEGSPYKNVYFNGSLGTMLGYSFAKNYLLMVEPSYRFALNSFTKDDFYLQSYPSSFMVSFGIAYNFK